MLGCSDSQDKTNATGVQAKNATLLPSQKSNAAVIEPAKSLAKNLEESQRIATRNELKVLTEEAKSDEDKIQEIMDRANQNLSDRNTLKQAEADIKNILPEYKEKMLQIAKAKLKDQKP